MKTYPWSYDDKTIKIYRDRQKKNKEHYNLMRILEEEAIYNDIFGERSNGKSYAVEELGIIDWVTCGNTMALIRRWDTDFMGKNGQAMFENLVKNGVVSDLTKGEWTNIKYESYRWYFTKYDEDFGKWIKQDQPFCYAFALNTAEHNKSLSFPTVKTVMFDEFITRKSYLPNEFVEFMNVLSTIIRDRENVRIFMLGNTVNKYCPYFADMGLTNIDTMKVGDLRLYQLGTTDTKIAVEYSDKPIKSKKSDKYFAFDNPKLKMITTGAWEIDIYPHLPYKYEEKNVLTRYFIQFDKTLLECKVIYVDNRLFTYIHRKTTPLKYPDKEKIYSPNYDSRPNWHRKLTRAGDKFSRRMCKFFTEDRVYYADNEIGEVVRNYLQWCVTGS